MNNISLNKSKLLIASLAILFVVFIIGGFISQRVSTEAVRMSTIELLDTKNGKECRFTESQQNRGTFYVGRGKLYGELSTRSANVNTDTRMLIASDVVSVWAYGQDSGFQIPIEVYNENSKVELQDQFNLKEQLELECRDWDIDERLFTLPISIDFQSISALSNSPRTPDPSLVPDPKACQACDTAPEENRAVCRQSLGCI